MADFIHAELRGSRFERADLSGAQLRAVDLSGARFRGVDLSGAVMRGVELVGADIHGEIIDLTINGVDIGPLVEAELDRRYPDRTKMRPADPDGFGQAWDIIERLWDQTVGRARRLTPELLHESVDGEWSFTETLRHLVFATDAWIRRAILGVIQARGAEHLLDPAGADSVAGRDAAGRRSPTASSAAVVSPGLGRAARVAG